MSTLSISTARIWKINNEDEGSMVACLVHVIVCDFLSVYKIDGC